MKKAFAIFAAVTAIAGSLLAQTPDPATPPGSVTPPAVPGPVAPGTEENQPQIAPPPIPTDTPTMNVEKDPDVPAVRVNSTNQNYDFIRPWDKGAPFTRRALGAVLSGDRVLVTGELVANSTFIELERPTTGERSPATVELVDYEANLALLKPTNAKFLEGVKPIELVTDSKVGDKLSAWQFEQSGTLIKTEGLLTSVQIGDYPLDNSDLLIYKITVALQPRDGSFTIPVIRDGKLAGVLMRYDPRTQNADAIAAPVVEHFLKDAQTAAEYRGFPKVGISFTQTRDPQLRRYAKLTNGEQGVYITDVLKDSAADKAGVKRGDVLIKIDGVQIDPDGNYQDSIHGKLALANLTAGKYPGDRLRFTVLREGQPVDVEVVLERKKADDYAIPPYTIDKGPAYFTIGGIVFEELTRQYLRSWGGDWAKRAPGKLVFYDRFQSELIKPPQKRLVILSQVLPTPITIGYEGYNNLIVSKVNGVDVVDLESLKKAFETPVDGFHVIETLDDPKFIHLDAKEIQENDEKIRKGYGIPKQ